MNTKELLGVLSVSVACVGIVPYFWDILHKRTKPHIFTWIIWALLSGIVFAAQWSDHAGAGKWSMGFSTISCVLVVILALVYGEKDIRKSDLVAFIAAMLVIPLWYFTGNPLWSVILASIIELLSFYPTFRKSFNKPQQETIIMYGFDSLGFMLALFALDKFSLTNALYPSIIMITNMTFVCMVIWRRHYLLTNVTCNKKQ